MSSYSASVLVDDDTLHVSRPLTAPDRVQYLIDSVTSSVIGSDGEVTSVVFTVETSGDSDTPIGDAVTGSSSTPLPTAEHPDDEPTPVAAALLAEGADPSLSVSA